MHPVPPALAHRPFTSAEAAALGLSWRTLQGRRFRRLLPDVCVAAAVPPTHEVGLRAALLLLPDDAVVSGASAARLHGFDPGGDDHLHLSTRADTRTRIPGVRLHRHRRPVHHQWQDGLRVTTPERTVVDCARRTGLLTLVQLVDHLVHTGRTDLDVPHDYVWAHGYHGVRRARRVLPLASAGAESPPETTLRLMIVLAHLPRPRANVEVHDHDGRLVARVDLLLEPWKVVVEYDGRHHETDARQWHRDRLRRERLEALGYRVVVVAAADARRPVTVVHRVHRALVDQGYTGPGPSTSVMWHRWFPSR